MFFKSKAESQLEDQRAITKALERENLYLRTQLADMQAFLTSQQLEHKAERLELQNRYHELVQQLFPNKERRGIPKPVVSSTPIFPDFRPDLYPKPEESNEAQLLTSMIQEANK